MAFKQFLLHTELPLRSRTLHAGHFRRDSQNVDAKARSNPKKIILDPACVMKAVA